MRKAVLIVLITTIILAAAGGNGFSAEEALLWEERSHPVYQAGGAYPRMYRLSNGTYLIGFDA
ncbi:MAG: hypothetical protein IJO53_12610, partial [Clostridia bacterium]|nr:hypothetical protein [Clostridia bacterium]